MTDGIWQIEQGCPQCGAPVTLAETDRLLGCPYCRTRLYLVAEKEFHYRIAPPAEEGETLYVPYWRLRGASFSVNLGEIAHRFVDASALAVDLPGLPPSLGFRPQTLKLRFLAPNTPGRFLVPTLPAPGAAIAPADPAQGIFYQDYIGETRSVIHAPLSLRDSTLVDAVLDRPLHACTAEERQRLDAWPAAPPSHVRFIPTLCPHCGWDLEGQKDSLVLLCRNCDSGWTCRQQAFERVDCAVLTPPDPAADIAAYLPFWRMRPQFTGLELATQADLIRLANLPKRVTSELESAPLFFWSPAFKVNPALYSRWVRQMTVFQPAGDAGLSFPARPLYPVTLPLSEAADGIMITLAQLIMDKRKWYPRLAAVRVAIAEARLEYHPFLKGQREWLHPALQVALDPTALAYGLRM